MPDPLFDIRLQVRQVVQLPAGLPSRALRRSEVAALSDGRCSGGFTPEATVAARRANAPELSVW